MNEQNTILQHALNYTGFCAKMIGVKTLLTKLKKADYDYELIAEGDVIAVGISGGKDSTLLLLALEAYRKISPKTFTIIGIHLNLGFGEEDFTIISSYFESIHMPLIVVETDVALRLEAHKTADGRIPCSLCSRFKKAAVIAEAKRRGATKVAFAHHADDAVETLLLNLIHGGKINTFEPKMRLSDSQMTFIRPFVYVHESEIMANVHQLKLPVIRSGCPMDGHTQRESMKTLLAHLYATYPQSKANLLKALHNPDQVKLWDPENHETFVKK
jgi:tRNA 2-thiocytidine biosynthesis protein TtcA